MSAVPLLVIVQALLIGSALTGPLLFLAVVLAPTAILLTLWILMRFLFNMRSSA
ncbi:hypothetical protein [Natrinema sp. 74]|uniref:hypothetical protein n=1 Tax=Natrinema sp. 74 TaxID=3384159 RepID=UPI0038D41440